MLTKLERVDKRRTAVLPQVRRRGNRMSGKAYLMTVRLEKLVGTARLEPARCMAPLWVKRFSIYISL
jgi:hypothetical protein